MNIDAMKQHRAVLLAVLAAACYGVSAPLSKLLLVELSPALMAALLYLGAGLGMGIINLLRGKRSKEAPITRKEWPYVLGMIVLDILAPIALMLGLQRTTPANASLLNNFEIVATSLIALLLFKEAVGRRLWMAIALITLSCILLTVEDAGSFNFSAGSLLVLLAAVCWGLENNCTRMLSLKDPLQVVVIKGFGSGTGALIIALMARETAGSLTYMALALLLGFFAYGLSITLYIRAQRELGAARTSAYYAVAPFIGVGLSFLMFREPVGWMFALAFSLMVLGAYFAAVERHSHLHHHEALTHEHRHSHGDGHHLHSHSEGDVEHSHVHTHAPHSHKHPHTPDLHHQHRH